MTEADSLQAELTKTQDECTRLSKLIARSRARLEFSQARSEELVESLSRAEIRRDELEVSLALQRARIEWLEIKQSRLSQGHKELTRASAQLADSYAILKSSARMADVRVKVAEDALRELRSKEESWQPRIESLADELAKSMEDARAQRAELATMEARVLAPRWLLRQFFKSMKTRLSEKIRRKRLVRSASRPAHDGQPASDVVSLVRDSGLFDETYYLAQCTDDPSAQADPIGHYLQIGAFQKKNPNPFFDTAWCLETHADLAANSLNPLVHYILYGSQEGRATSPEFDAGYYLRSHPDVAVAGIEPLKHFLQSGRYEGRLAAAMGQRQDGSSFFPVVSSSALGLIAGADIEQSGTPLADLLPAVRSSPAKIEGRLVDVVIPVYAGLRETLQCIESVLESRRLNKRFGTLYIVDDCGPEPELRNEIRKISLNNSDVVLLVNEKNLGFVKSVNRAMRATTRDIVLLNADTAVNADWVDRLAAHSARCPKAATITAFSNNATICTFPEIGGSPTLPFGFSLSEIDAGFSSANNERSVEVPTGVGFCFFINRRALEELGLFDEAFGRGYGEETDFCRKAVRAGWTNLLAADVFVFHHGSVSFGASAAEEQVAGGAMMRERYPDYERAVSRWIGEDPARNIRLTALAGIFSQQSMPVLLHVLHPWGGGTEKQVSEIAAEFASGLRHLVLITHKNESRYVLDLLVPDQGKWRKYVLEFDNLLTAGQWLKTFGIARVHVHHALEVMDELPALLQVVGAPYDVSVHDYALICPRTNLFRDGQYCGEPDTHGCLNCLRQDPVPRSRDIVLWRHKGVGILEAAERVICPTIDVANRIRRYAPQAEVIAVPHEPDLYHPQRAYTLPSVNETMRFKIAALGIFAEHKGGVFLLECIERARAQRLPIDWVVIGWFPGALAERARSLKDVLTITGPYLAEDVSLKIEEADPHLIFFPQHCAETYSYTLTEAMVSGRAILAPALGAFPERITGVEGCWAYDVSLSPAQLLQKLETLRVEVFGKGDLGAFPQFTQPYRDEKVPVTSLRVVYEK